MTLRNDKPCQGGCGKVRSILYSDSPTEWLCNDCRTRKQGRSKAAKARKDRIAELRAIINAEETRIFEGARPQISEYGQVIVDTATCGTCGKSWNDALITSHTPAPSARCPFEYVHEEIKELRRLTHGRL